MLFFMTGLQAIPPEMYEAASIDGASNTRQFLTITIPLLGPVLQMVLMNAILGSLKVTDLVLTLTNGKPSGKTEVMMTYIYKKFFGDGGASGLDFGYGAALTVAASDDNANERQSEVLSVSVFDLYGHFDRHSAAVHGLRFLQDQHGDRHGRYQPDPEDLHVRQL